MTINVSAANDAPVNLVPISQGTAQDADLVFSLANSNLVSIVDVDAGTSDVSVTLTATHGVLTLGGTTGLIFTFGDGTNDGTMTFAGTVSEVNAALVGLTFSPTASFIGLGYLEIATSDLGNTGSGGTLTDDDVVNIAVGSVNSAPTNTVPSTQTIDETTLSFFRWVIVT